MSTTEGTVTEQRWIAFGASGAAGSILHTNIGYTVRMLNDETARGIYPTLEVAKSALHASMPPGSEWPEFREH
ncbi:MAG: methyltransferase [Acidobacteria bacterium]|nr:methyltransferase [Acidobacteriota bacterium]